jgi:hypothetical protein
VEQRDAATDLDRRDKDVEAHPLLGRVLLETLSDLVVHRWLAGGHVQTVRVPTRADKPGEAQRSQKRVVSGVKPWPLVRISRTRKRGLLRRRDAHHSPVARGPGCARIGRLCLGRACSDLARCRVKAVVRGDVD